MLFKQASRGDERIYQTIKNVEASSLTTGYGVALRVGTAASFDGINAVLSDSDNAADLPAWVGVAAQDIASNAYGLIQSYGLVASVLLSHIGSSLTVNSGDPLVPGKGAGGFFSGAPTYANSGFKYILASNTPAAISGTAYMSGIMTRL